MDQFQLSPPIGSHKLLPVAQETRPFPLGVPANSSVRSEPRGTKHGDVHEPYTTPNRRRTNGDLVLPVMYCFVVFPRGRLSPSWTSCFTWEVDGTTCFRLFGLQNMVIQPRGHARWPMVSSGSLWLPYPCMGRQPDERANG